MSDLKPLSAEELDYLEGNDPCLFIGPNTAKPLLMRLIQQARASLAPKGWPSEEEANAEAGRRFHNDPEGENGWNAAIEWLASHHAAPQAKPDRSYKVIDLTKEPLDDATKREIELLDYHLKLEKADKLLSLYRAECDAAKHLAKVSPLQNDTEHWTKRREEYRAARAARIAAESGE